MGGKGQVIGMVGKGLKPGRREWLDLKQRVSKENKSTLNEYAELVEVVTRNPI